MKILILTQWFEPEPTFKGLSFARALLSRGHQVEVLTGFPNYPGGELYAGYRIRPWRRETMDGIRVNRVALYPSHDKSGAKRAANYGSFALSAAFLGPLLVQKPDVIYAYHPPATIGVAAAALKARFHAPLVYDIQDMWPDSIATTGMLTHPAGLALLGGYCKALYQICDQIVVLSPGFKTLLIERGVPENKIEVVYNWTRESEPPQESDPETAMGFGLDEGFNVLFAGTMGLGQGLDAVLDAAHIVAKRTPEVRFVFVGGGVDRARLERRTREGAMANVRFLPRQPPSAMGSIFAAADVLMVHLKADPLFRITIPSKTQAYMYAGKPILMAVEGAAADLVRQAGAGAVCSPGDPGAIADAVNRLFGMTAAERAMLGEAGRSYYLENLSLRAGVERFEKIFSKVTRGGRPANA